MYLARELEFTRYGLKEEKLSKCFAPHVEAWKIVSGEKVTGRISYQFVEFRCDSLVSGQL